LTRFLIIISVVLAALPAAAQDDDRGRLIRFIESQLSDGENRQVRIDGFRGALSSEATLERLAISDADGEWLVLENAQLNWRRAALLSGALAVEALTAERLTLLRPPLPPEGPDLPTAEATPFALPELPLRVRIGEFSIGTVALGEPIMGVAAELSVTGEGQLEDGSGTVRLEMARLDGPEGRFNLDAGFDNATRILGLDLLLEEEAGGLAAELLSLPDEPPLRLHVAGEGPLDDIVVDLGLATSGVERVDGTIRSARTGEDGGQRIDIDIAGDLTPLMATEYRPFFGTSSEISAEIDRLADGSTLLQDMRLATAAVLLQGDIALDAESRPVSIDIAGRVEDPDGSGPVRLPAPGVPAFLSSADLAFVFDAAQGDGYRMTARLDDLDVGDFSIADAEIAATGRITPSATGIGAVTADLTAALSGLDHTDAALAEAMGRDATFGANAAWAEGESLSLEDLAVRAGGMEIDGTLTASFVDGTLPVVFRLAAGIDELGRFSALAGQDLSGGLNANLEGTAEALSGAFDIVLAGTGTSIGASPALPPALLSGQTRLRLVAVRDITGTRIDELTVDGTQIALDATGEISSGGGTFSADARLSDLGLFTSAVRGPATVSADLARAGAEDNWQIDARLQGPAGLGANVTGSADPDTGNLDLQTTGTVPLALANQFIAPRSITGALRFDLAVRGAPSLGAVSGTLSTAGARLSAPTFLLAVEDIGLNARLNGGRVTLDGGGNISTGGRLGLNGSLDLGQRGLPGNIAVTLDGARLIDPTLYQVNVARGDLAVSGPLASAPFVAGLITLGESELRVPETGLGAAAPIPDIRHIGETAAERQTRAAAGLLAGQGGNGGSSAVGLDLTINAPGRIFLRGRGIDAEFGGSIRIGGTSANVIPAGRFELVRGRISILGTRLDITEGAATLQGDFDPFLQLRAESRANGYRITINVDGPASSPDISLSSDPFLPEDEILAQLLFGRSVSALSPVQLIQLADAASSLVGGSTDGGLLANLREGLGLDDLDLQTDAEGNAAVRAGRYLSENIYTDVTVGAQGESEISLNIDLTPDITARGSFSSDGGSALGVYFERDY
jgi:translocation and assembly module TamB